MPSSHDPIIVWFRQDLRLADNPALHEAVATGRPVVPLFVLHTASDGREWGAASKAFETWKKTTPQERASYLFKAAELIRQRRFHYDALLVFEVGKSWVEADGDISEAIDFLEFYAREALRYAHPQPVVPLEGERNELIYIPLGVGAVIPPWNFAAAIMIGMTSAAIVSGNTVVLKPSSD